MVDPAWQATNPFFLECFALAAPKLDDATGAQIAAYWRDTFAKHDTRLRSNIPVSYTHLDVYKRQAMFRRRPCLDASMPVIATGWRRIASNWSGWNRS